MKRITYLIRFAIAMAVLCATTQLSVAQYTLQDQDVTLDHRQYITECTYGFAITDIIIPDTLQGIAIKGIGIAAFQNKGITSVVLPSTLKRIEGTAFRGNALTTVQFPAGLTYIGRHSFRDNQLTSAVVPDAVEFIGNEAFKNNNITSATLSNSLVYLGYQAFVDNQLTTISLPTSINYIGVQAFINNSFTSFVLPNNTRPGFQFWLNSNGDTLTPTTTVTALNLSYTASIVYTLNDTDVVMENGFITHCRFGIGTVLTIPPQLQGQNVIGVADREEQEAGVFSFMGILDINLPNGFKYLGEYSFCDNSFYNSDMTFPASLEHIGYFAFYWSNIKSVVIPDAVTYIGELAFGWNPRLETLHLGNSVEYIGDYAFVRGDITNLTIPNSVTHIGRFAFERNEISTLTLGNSVQHIGQAAFNINNLSNLTLPNSVAYIGAQAFRQNNLSSMTLPAATKTGHTFINWVDENSVTHAANASVTNFNIYYEADFSVNNGTVIFNVSDDDGELAHAEIVLDGNSYFTGYNGQTIVAGLPNGTHPYLVKKPGYFDVTGTVEINNDHDIVNVQMSVLTYQQVTFQVIDNLNDPIQNAQLVYDSDTLTTDVNGYANAQLVTGHTYHYTLSAPGFLPDSGSFTIGYNDTTIVLVLPVDTTGILNQVHGNPAILLYPNPVGERLQVHFDQVLSTPGTIEIISLSGQVLSRHQTTDHLTEIDMTRLSKGIYFVRVFDEQRVLGTFRVIRR